MTFVINQYSRQNLNTIGTLTPDNAYPAIKLPLPLQMVDTNHVQWQEAEVGTLPGIGVSVGKDVAGTAGAVVGGLTAVGGATLLAAGSVVPGTQGLTVAAEALAGIMPSQFITMLMRGPTYKRHRWTWEFSPNNNQEADQLRQITNAFKNALSPNFYQIATGGGPVLWKFPHIFHIRLYPNSKFMYKFKPCVCDYFTTNYMPGGRGAFYANKDGTDGNNPPEGVQLQMNFIELEYWTEGNFTDSNDPDDVYNNNSLPFFHPSNCVWL
jgi:hypothetical protein